MHRALIRCHSCRITLLDSFASLAGISIPPLSHPKIQLPQSLQRRQLNNARILNRQSSPIERIIQDEDIQISSQAEPEPTFTSSKPSSVPWYLQVDTPTPPASSASPLLALQEIPPIPRDAPPILSPVLEHLSISIGLDNLTLLDLRHLDPPPALGANLFMIIGTARSIKHLNVSADRFCRWCRSTYKLRPYADGLLGRNELKLKLRRRARKLKLAQSVGNTVAMMQRQGQEVDDGITTGWICVNMGIIEDGVYEQAVAREAENARKREDIAQEAQDEEQQELGSMNNSTSSAGTTPLNSKSESLHPFSSTNPITPSQSQQSYRDNEEVDEEEEEEEYENPSSSLDPDPNPQQSYVGFGSQSTAPRIVVQMFVEEKRLEMDLEGLWDARNSRRARRVEKAEKVEKAQEAEEEETERSESLENVEKS